MLRLLTMAAECLVTLRACMGENPVMCKKGALPRSTVAGFHGYSYRRRIHRSPRLLLFADRLLMHLSAFFFVFLGGRTSCFVTVCLLFWCGDGAGRGGSHVRAGASVQVPGCHGHAEGALDVPVVLVVGVAP